jgi:hypothetical protein
MRLNHLVNQIRIGINTRGASYRIRYSSTPFVFGSVADPGIQCLFDPWIQDPG